MLQYSQRSAELLSSVRPKPRRCAWPNMRFAHRISRVLSCTMYMVDTYTYYLLIITSGNCVLGAPKWMKDPEVKKLVIRSYGNGTYIHSSPLWQGHFLSWMECCPDTMIN